MFITHRLAAGMKHFYAKVSTAYIDQSHFRLPDSFRPQNDYQSDWEREDSYEKDSKISTMVGITPTNNSEAYITYVRPTW